MRLTFSLSSRGSRVRLPSGAFRSSPFSAVIWLWQTEFIPCLEIATPAPSAPFQRLPGMMATFWLHPRAISEVKLAPCRTNLVEESPPLRRGCAPGSVEQPEEVDPTLAAGNAYPTGAGPEIARAGLSSEAAKTRRRPSWGNPIRSTLGAAGQHKTGASAPVTTTTHSALCPQTPYYCGTLANSISN
jgi:hypothetical protein